MKEEGQPFEELFAQARSAYEADNDQSESYWDIVWLLANRGDQETLENVLPLTRGDAFERNFAASVLGPFAPRIHFDPEEIIQTPRRFASAEITDVLLQMLEAENDEGVIAALVSSLGQHREQDERIPRAIGRFLRHPSTDIRWSLAVGLGSYKSTDAVEMLVELSYDRDAGVRDWATFGLGRQGGLDSPAIRTALSARFSDKAFEVRLKAIEGLAVRHDPRAATAFLREFKDGSNWERLFFPAERLLVALKTMAKEPQYAGSRAEAEAAIALCEAILLHLGTPATSFPAPHIQPHLI